MLRVFVQKIYQKSIDYLEFLSLLRVKRNSLWLKLIDVQLALKLKLLKQSYGIWDLLGFH